MDNDKQAYMPGASYSANISEPSESAKSDGILRQNFTLARNNYDDYSVATYSGVQKWPFGKCKPGLYQYNYLGSSRIQNISS